jgi:hypothetical protein
MDEGTLKTPIPKCRHYWSFLFGVVKHFVGSESGQKQSVTLLQNMVYNTNQDPPPHSLPPHSHTLSLCTFTTITLGKGRGVGQREGEGQQYIHKYSSFVHVGNSSQAGSKILTMSECIFSL